jgi:hypothetical protein
MKSKMTMDFRQEILHFWSKKLFPIRIEKFKITKSAL